jgi:hypothetical protein
MTIKRLLTVVVAICAGALAVGLMSLSAEMRAVTWMAGEGVAQADTTHPVDSGAYLVANVVGDGDEMLLFPQTGDVIRCKGGTICTEDGPYAFDSGRLYTWVNGHKHRVWLFGVVADEQPNVHVDGRGRADSDRRLTKG